MPGKTKKRGIICRSAVDFERIYLPRSFERREKEKVLREPGAFGKSLEKEMIRSLKKGRSGKGKKES